MINHGGLEAEYQQEKNENLLFDHGAHYLSINHEVEQLRILLNNLNIVDIKEINFSANFLKKEILRKKF